MKKLNAKKFSFVLGFFVFIYLFSFNIIDNGNIEQWKISKSFYLERDINISAVKAPKLPSYYPEPFKVTFFNQSGRRNSTILQRVITETEYNEYMHLIFLVAKLLGTHNITYMLTDGSMLGSWRHWDFVPWDDDFDFIVDLNDKEKLMSIVNNATFKTHYKNLGWSLTLNREEYVSGEYMKLFLQNSTIDFAGRYEHRWPFIDIFYYKANKTNLWHKINKINRLDEIFPLKLRPFGQYWLPAASKPRNLIKRFFKNAELICSSSIWDHKNEKRKKRANSVSCHELKNDYEFVIHNCINDRCTESLYRNGSILGKIEFID